MKYPFKLSQTLILTIFAVECVLVVPAALSASSPFIVTPDRASEILLSNPTPKYPLEARRQHMTGMGKFEVRVDAPTGKVTGVTVLRSTGFPILDRSATDTLRRWKFRPNKVSKIRLPITFSMKSR